MQLLTYKWNYDLQINTKSPTTFSIFTVGTDWVKSVKNYAVKDCAKQPDGSEVASAQLGSN
jgi:hypothetical protein